MEESNRPDAEYVSGYNQGYTIAKHLPDLADKLAQAVGDTDRGNGFKSGREQFLSEAKEDRRPTWLKKDRLSDLDKDKPSKEIDKDNR